MSVTITPYVHTPYSIDVNTVVNGGSSGGWVLGSSTISHNNSLGSLAYKTIPSLVFGNTYRVTYTISSYTDCNVRVYLGDTAGIVRTSAGTFVETMTLTGVNKRISFYSSGHASINSYLIEQLVVTTNDHLLDIDTMQNNSWTLSFNPILNQWISFHSYLPNNYLLHPVKTLVKGNDSQLKLNNSGNYGEYLDNTIKPFILETICNEFKENTKVFDSITVIMDTTDSNDVFSNSFFSDGIVYTENQCSGVIDFTIEDNVTRKEKNWNLNKFLDITNNASQKIFVSDWNSIRSSYPIDKIVNVGKIDNSKPWYQRGRMRDKYLAVRFIEDNTSNSKFTIKFILTSFRASQR